jgi:multidrug efflux pump subunit AcrB
VLGITAAAFVGSLFLLKFVKQEFFPPSVRPEVIIEMTLPEGSSLRATEAEAQRLAELLDGDGDIDNYSYYVGQGAPRFVLTTDPVLPSPNYAQFVVVAKDLKARENLQKKIDKLLAESFPAVRGHVKLIQTGPPSPYPVMLRVSGYEHDKVREIAGKVVDVMAANPNLLNINLDWNEKSKIMRLAVDQDKARQLGIDSQSLASSLQMQLSGAAISEFREQDRTVAIVLRLEAQDRQDLSAVGNLPVHIGGGKFVPLEQVAKLSYEARTGLSGVVTSNRQSPSRPKWRRG